MSLFGGRRSAHTVYRNGEVEVRALDGVLTLHLASDIVQSAMRMEQPTSLELAYTRAMMAFRLFVPLPRYCLLIGLGGGSLAKFLYFHLTDTRIRAIESRPEVIAVARSHFQLPSDDARLQVVAGDGAGLVRDQDEAPDVILVDAFDGRSQAPALASEAFYRDCRAVLGHPGVLVVNLWSSERTFDANLQLIERAFEGRCLCLPCERPGNIIVFGFSAEHRRYPWDELERRASDLEGQLPLGFSRFVADLRLMNRHDRDAVELA